MGYDGPEVHIATIKSTDTADVADFDTNYRNTSNRIVDSTSKSRFSGRAITISSAGNNTIYTPPSGGRINLIYLSLSADGSNTSDVVVTVKFEAGSTKYIYSLKPGSILARNIGAGNRSIQGNVDEPVIVSLSTAQTVHVSIEFDEYL